MYVCRKGGKLEAVSSIVMKLICQICHDSSIDAVGLINDEGLGSSSLLRGLPPRLENNRSQGSRPGKGVRIIAVARRHCQKCSPAESNFTSLVWNVCEVNSSHVGRRKQNIRLQIQTI